MLWFTPDVEEAFSWFAATHELEIAHGVARWRLRWLPQAGGMGDQDALLMMTLDYIRSIENARLTPAPKAEA